MMRCRTVYFLQKDSVGNSHRLPRNRSSIWYILVTGEGIEKFGSMRLFLSLTIFINLLSKKIYKNVFIPPVYECMYLNW